MSSIPPTSSLAPSSSSLPSSSSPSRPAEETIEKLSRWKKRWDDDMIGWHKDEPHRNLLKHGKQIIPSFDEHNNNDAKTCQSENNDFRIFVPLCGKSVDMAYLAQHPSVSEVVGIDGIRKALVSFQNDNPMFEIQSQNESPSIDSTDESNNKVERFKGNKIQLLRGDIFDINDEVTNGKFDMILDRASIVAIQPNLRPKYVSDIMSNLIKKGGKILLMTIDRRSGTEDARKKGPPFSIDEKEVRLLFEDLDWVEDVKLVDEYDEFQDEGMKQKFGSQGLDSVYELCFIITAKK